MNDFVSRVAARAVGQAAVARPRLPALFEPAGSAVGLEVVEESVAPRPHAGTHAGQAPALAGAVPPPRDRELAAPATPRPLPLTPSRAQRKHDVLRDDLVLADPDRGDAEPERVVEIVAAESAPVFAPAAPPPAAPIVTPVAVAAPVARPTPTEPTAAAPSAVADVPHVRVHIGRLEVRANLSTSSPERPPERARPQPQELSLSDYLRGRRSRS